MPHKRKAVSPALLSPWLPK